MVDLQNALFSDPKIEYPIHNMELHFDDYITKCKSIIATTRIDLNNHTAEKIIEANSPFELKPNTTNKPKIGILLIHGLLDTPFQLRDIGKQLQSQGCLVRSVLLSGHGTVPGALLHVDYHEWLQTVRYGIASLKKEVDTIILVGNSTGASLALYHAMEHSATVSGIILLSPALKIRSIFAPTSSWYRAISWAWKRAAWFHIDPEETIDYAKYQSLPYNAIYQVYRLSKELKRRQTTNEPLCPLFFVLSQHDKIVCPETIIDYFHAHTNPKSRLLLYTHQSNNFNDTRIQIRPSAYPQHHIINMPHIAIPIAPDNMHYGKSGDFKYASHVDDNKPIIYGEYLRDDLFYNRCMLKLHLTKTHKERLTFNPDFDYMSECIKKFVNND